MPYVPCPNCGKYGLTRGKVEWEGKTPRGPVHAARTCPTCGGSGSIWYEPPRTSGTSGPTTASVTIGIALLFLFVFLVLLAGRP
jgi:DnaJ-class molecular chaperone